MTRETSPASSATIKPAARPPAVIAMSDSPASEKADRGARQDGMRHDVAHQAHAAQHQEHPDRGRPQRQGEAADEGPAHERELLKGADHGIDERHQSAFGHGPAASSQDCVSGAGCAS